MDSDGGDMVVLKLLGCGDKRKSSAPGPHSLVATKNEATRRVIGRKLQRGVPHEHLRLRKK
jgi:hypothetical protein